MRGALPVYAGQSNREDAGLPGEKVTMTPTAEHPNVMSPDIKHRDLLFVCPCRNTELHSASTEPEGET